MPVRLTRLADADINGILRDTLVTFGEGQMQAYATLLDRAIGRVNEDPGRASSRRRDDIAPDVRSYHVALAAERQGAASHLIYFTELTGALHGRGVVILRVLHERMEQRRRVMDGLRIAQTSQEPKI